MRALPTRFFVCSSTARPFVARPFAMRACAIWPLAIALCMGGIGSVDANARDAVDTPAAVATDTQDRLEARGVVRAVQTAEIAAPLAARLTEVPFRDGAWFAKGAVIARFDCAAMEAELEALTSAHATLELRHANQAELFKLGAAGELDVRLAKSEMDQAASEARAIRTRLKDCTLAAPWPGHVAKRHLQAHETPVAGQPIYSLVRSGRTEMTLIVPSAWSDWLDAGTRFDFTIDETGETVPAKITRLGAVVDPVSQTLEVIAVPTAKSKAKPGMSGTARFTTATDE